MVKVLVAEDDSFLSSLLVRDLEGGGFEARASYDGVQTSTEIQAWQPDIVLLDLLMPAKDGFQVLEELRAEPHGDKLPVLVLSNLGDQASIDRVKKLNVVDYVVKANTTPHEVVEKIRTILNS